MSNGSRRLAQLARKIPSKLMLVPDERSASTFFIQQYDEPQRWMLPPPPPPLTFRSSMPTRVVGTWLSPAIPYVGACTARVTPAPIDESRKHTIQRFTTSSPFVMCISTILGGSCVKSE